MRKRKKNRHNLYRNEPIVFAGGQRFLCAVLGRFPSGQLSLTLLKKKEVSRTQGQRKTLEETKEKKRETGEECLLMACVALTPPLLSVLFQLFPITEEMDQTENG